MRRTIFTEEHELFRESARTYYLRECAPHAAEWVIDGSKTFITNGILADLVIVACKTDPQAGHKGISLIVVERGAEGFERGRKLDKVGMKAQDTAELFFHGARVPAENLIGQE